MIDGAVGKAADCCCCLLLNVNTPVLRGHGAGKCVSVCVQSSAISSFPHRLFPILKNLVLIEFPTEEKQ